MLDLLGDRAELVGGVLVEFVFLVDPLDGDVGRDGNDVHLVDVVKFRRLGCRRAGHAGELGVHAEIVLEGDRGHRLVFGLDLDTFLGLDRLMQAVRPATAIHHTTGEFVDDDDLAVLDDIIGVGLEHHVRAQRLVGVVHHLRVLEIIEICALEQPGILEHPLDLLGAVHGQDDRLLLFVLLIILGRKLLHDQIDRAVQVRLVVGWARDDQRGTRFVDQHRIDFVDDRHRERALHHRFAIVLHVVAQIIEAELVIGAVSDVGGIGLAALFIGQIGHDHAHRHAEEIIDLRHPARVARRQIVVDGNDMHALAGQRVEIGGERRDQRLALARAHLGNFAAVEHDAADHLHVVMPLAERALGRFAHRGEGLGQQIVELFARRETFTELGGLARQLLIGHGGDDGLEAVDLGDDDAERFDVAVVGRPEKRFGNAAEHGEFLLR